MYKDTLQNRLRFKWADNGSGHMSDYTADLILAADTIDALQNMVSQLEKDNKWQTMETAHKDGTNILGFSKHDFHLLK